MKSRWTWALALRSLTLIAAMPGLSGAGVGSAHRIDAREHVAPQRGFVPAVGAAARLSRYFV